MASKLKEKLRSGSVTIGSWITLGHAGIAEIMARSGFDWLTIDLEHSVIDLHEMQEMIRVCDLNRVTPLVRLSSNDPVQIKRVMDAGAGGIIVPNVRTAEEVESAFKAMHYPPTGNRGVGLARAQGYGSTFEEYKKWLAEDSIFIVQIEHRDAVENLDKILSVRDLDAFIIGPYDLSGSLGAPGDFENPQFKGLLAEVTRTAKAVGICPGIHVVEPETNAVEKAVLDGYRMIAFSVDIRMIDSVCRKGLNQLRSALV